MSEPKQITIVGGGLAGLALGIGLRRHAVPVRLLEAGSYPRHRVCGEFICGIESSTLESLGIKAAFEPQILNKDSRWFYRSRPVLKKPLPTPAIGISRHHLDAELATEFTHLGGEVLTNTRAKTDDLPDEGTVWTSGRQRTKEGDWLGLKCHVRGNPMDTDLQMHFGQDCYVGLSRVEGETTNVCGIFKKQPGLKAAYGRDQLLLEYLRSSQLDVLANRLEKAEIDSDSLLGVSAFQLGHQPGADDGKTLRIGDAWSMIPPFTGNGMTMAFQSAEIALAPIHEFATGVANWEHTTQLIRQKMHRRFDRRVRWAMAMHPLLLGSAGQKTLVALAKFDAVPFGLVFKKTRT